MPTINFLAYKDQLNIKYIHRQRYIWCFIRKKFMVLTPEEIVRQLVILYLIQERGYNKNRVSVEKQLKINGRIKRCDILIYNQQTEPHLLVECKAPNIPISQVTFDQIARYNLALNVRYFIVTNGIQTFCCQVNHQQATYDFLEIIPEGIKN